MHPCRVLWSPALWLGPAPHSTAGGCCRDRWPWEGGREWGTGAAGELPKALLLLVHGKLLMETLRAGLPGGEGMLGLPLPRMTDC